MTAFVFSSALAVKPAFNHTNKTITVSDKFMKEAVKPFTNEFNDLMELRRLCPDYTVITRSHRSPRKTEKSKSIPKFVSYDHMEKYPRCRIVAQTEQNVYPASTVIPSPIAEDYLILYPIRKPLHSMPS